MRNDTENGREFAYTPRDSKLAAGLYFVATPIGSARDITLRGLDILASCDVIAAEDTRTLRHLMEIHGVALNGRAVLPYHDHNGAEMRPKIMSLLGEGKSVAYASEAGTPLVADPGFALGRAAIADGHMVTTAPGASASLAALTVSGLPSDRFLFAGFPPSKSGERRKFLQDLDQTQATLILYESPKRIHKLLNEMAEIWSQDRQIALCRELTKKFEEVIRGSLADVIAAIEGRALKGEIVVVIDRAEKQAADEATVIAALRARLKTARLKEAAAQVATELGLPKRDVYQLGLSLDADP
ncbi:16S rRNA (cytidine(1402)-2'-O)-methyltransferase [Roseobacter sp. HKCCD7870]|uniref:16S rRNA (cytidine(1402)-2'-O)-methyltransferase n=1 Tax=Roseobacter sp. HKCCD7870 TaxID=3120343 RepID=UPI0030EB7982